MVAYSALSLLLTLISLSTSVNAKYYGNFISAIGVNICQHEHGHGLGPGRHELVTVEAKCMTTTSMKLLCRYIAPVVGPEAYVDYQCAAKKFCLPTTKAGEGSTYAELPDAGCSKVPALKGEKGPFDPDRIACSQGLNVGDAPVYLSSSFSADTSTDSIISCTIRKSGGDGLYHLFSHKPCEKSSTVLRFEAKTTYQACLEFAASFASVAVVFHWNLAAPGRMINPHRKRGLDGLDDEHLDDERPLSEMFTIDDSVGDNAFPIVMRD